MAIDLSKGAVFSGEQNDQNGTVHADQLNTGSDPAPEVPEGYTSYRAVNGVFNTALKNGVGVKFVNGHFRTDKEEVIEELEYFVKLGVIVKE